MVRSNKNGWSSDAFFRAKFSRSGGRAGHPTFYLRARAARALYVCEGKETDLLLCAQRLFSPRMAFRERLLPGKAMALILVCVFCTKML